MNYHHQYQQSENRHKLKYLHLTYKGHYQLPVPEDWKYEFLFYCYENEMTNEEEEETSRQDNGSNIFASTNTTQQQKQKPMLQQYDELPSQKQEIKRLESSSQEMDFEEENSTSFRYDYQ